MAQLFFALTLQMEFVAGSEGRAKYVSFHLMIIIT
jgi:hypothetical protein